MFVVVLFPVLILIFVVVVVVVERVWQGRGLFVWPQLTLQTRLASDLQICLPLPFQCWEMCTLPPSRPTSPQAVFRSLIGKTGTIVMIRTDQVLQVWSHESIMCGWKEMIDNATVIFLCERIGDSALCSCCHLMM